MKALLLLSVLALAACTTDVAGNKAFLGLNSTQWLGVGQTAVVSYGTRRALTTAKQPQMVNP